MTAPLLRLAAVLVSAPLAFGLLAAPASASTATAALPAAASVLTQDPIGPPTGMDPSAAPMGPAVPEVTAPTAPSTTAGPATALPRTGDETTVLLVLAGVLLVAAGVLMHIAARPVRRTRTRFIVQLA